MSTKFKKKKEDFTCEKCSFSVVGTGYTNHCPQCLYSKHVDVNPGDRLATCGGLMEPVDVEGTVKRYMLTHKCTICGHKKKNKVEDEDSIDVLVALATKKGNRAAGR